MVYVSNDFISSSLVSVFIFTYNQEQYIAQTIESILQQKTKYKYEIVLVDDCSNDKTKEICLSYQKKNPSVIKFIANDSNKGLIKNYHESISEFCSGKYIAQCAGDDYWYCSDKLEEQVKILESDHRIGLVHTQIIKLNVSSDNFSVSSKDRSATGFENLLRDNYISAPTVCFRKDLYLNFLQEVNPLEKKWIAEDTPMWLWFSLHSGIYYWDKPTVVYRVISGSISNTNSSRKYFDFIKSRLNIKEYFIRNFNGSNELLEFIYNDFYKDASYHALKLKEKSTLDAISLHHKINGRSMKSFYFYIMSKLEKYEKLYVLLFFLYRVYFKLKRNYLVGNSQKAE